MMSAMSASMISSIVWMMNLIAKSKKGLLKLGSFKYSPYLCSRIINHVMNGSNSERLSQEGECHQDCESGILERASAFAQRVLEEIKALAGTTACKSVQLVRLRKWAEENGCWFNDCSQFGDFFDRGSENEVYLSPDQKSIIKLNDFRYSDDNLTSFFERIKAHNNYFPDCKYVMIGFAENRDGHVCAVLVQPFIADARLATKEEVHDEFIHLGFHPEDNGEYYTNGRHDIFDAVDGNVLVDDEGYLFFIDTIIYESGTGGVETYNSLSPRAQSSRSK